MKKGKNIIEVESVTINIGDTTVKVTPQQCRELYNALANLLGEPKYSFTPRWYGFNAANNLEVVPCSGVIVGDTESLAGHEITIQ